MRKIVFILAIFVVAPIVLCHAQEPVPLKVCDGLLQGKLEYGLTIYRGIPFAAPPVGDLRWRNGIETINTII